MENILNIDEENKRPKTNYKKWSFRLFIYAIIANIIFTYRAASHATYIQPNKARDLMILSTVIIVCLTLGLVLTFLMYTNKEEKNYQYKISILGIPILIVLTILAKFV